jgi:hypothetical protein
MARVHVRFLSSLSLLAVSTLARSQGVPQNMRLPQKPSATLPANAPTAPAYAAPAAASPQSSVVVQTARRARVDYSGGMLTVAAENSSLNQILREISRLSNLKITGGVADERVYGTYGPAPLPAILATLLNGTGSNMFLIQDASAVPRELVLTPRQGGASPPSPMSRRDEEQSDLPPQLTPRTSNAPDATPQRENPARPQQWTPSAIPQANNPPATAPQAPSTPDTTTEQSPNGVKTPQQIYDQLIKMQQQQPKAPQ